MGARGGPGLGAMTGRVLANDGRLPRGDDKRRAVEEMFDRVAPRYERVNRVISLGLDRRWRARAVASLGVSGGRILDLACGTGDLARDVAASGHRAVGIDLSAGMLHAAHDTPPLVRGDAVQLPFPEESLDGVVCGFALRNFVELGAVFAEIARVLRAGGRLAALDAAVPTNPVMRAGNALWFRGAVPLVGRVLSGDADAYRYLPRSTAYLPEPTTLLADLGAAGFADVRRVTMTGGSVQLLTGTRA
jgi:demethylmenaquinone methyltransferase / 2-methoxy-6-polyprenyl-1,4-benzoquinol methylase